MRITEQVCPVYKCGRTYTAISEHTTCPRCGFSVYEVDHVGSNDPQVLRNYDWRMEFKRQREEETDVEQLYYEEEDKLYETWRDDDAS